MNSSVESALTVTLKRENDLEDRASPLRLALKLSRVNNLTPEDKSKLEEELDEIESSLKAVRALKDKLLLQMVPSGPVEKQWKAPANLPRFQSGAHVREFIRKYEAAFRAEGIPEAKWLEFLPLSFSGTDLDVLDAQVLKKAGGRWETCKELLLSHFGPRQPLRSAYTSLLTLYQFREEQLHAYVGRFRALASEANSPDNNFIVASFLRGLHSNLRQLVLQSSSMAEGLPDFPDIESVIACAFDMVPFVRTSTRKEQPSQPLPKAESKRFQTERRLPQQPRINLAQAVQEEDTTAEIKSSSNYSPAPTTPLTATSDITTQPNVLVVKNDDNSQPFVAPIVLEGIKILALIDTGASISIMSQEAAELLNIETEECQGFLQLAQKDTKVVRKRSKKPLHLECGTTKIEVKLHVLPLPDDTSFILGRDLLSTLGIGITNVPIFFPDEHPKESDECRICDEHQIARLTTEDQDPHFFKEVSNEVCENEALDPRIPCKLPRGGYKLNVKPNSPFIFRRQYKLAPCKQEALDQTVAKWIESGVVVRCKEGSPYNSPIMTVPKRDELGTKTGTRVCIDPRPINEILEDDNFLVPLVTDVFERTAGCTYFTTIDLREAYTQIPLHSDSQQLTAFNWKGLQYCFTRCIFGIKTMSAMFQRIITNVLESCLEFAVSYVDDIVIFSKSKEEHILHVRQVLEALTGAHLRINSGKCKFGMRKVKLLGFLVSHEGIIPEQARLKEIFDVPRPTSVKEIQSFLGMTNYLRMHIPRYADLAKPLEAVRMKDEFTWTNELEHSFSKLKTAIAHAKMLYTPNPALPFYLATDASNVGISAMLYQMEGDTKRFISFESRALRTSERNYHAHKKELLAVVFALLKNQHLLRNRSFMLITDHQSLIYLKSQKNTNIMMENWYDVLASFDFKVTHLPGAQNIIPDFLSRAPCKSHTILTIDAPDVHPTIPAGIDLTRIHSQGHFQADNMVAWLRDRGHSWPGMRGDCENIARNCVTCQRCNPAPATSNPLTPIDAARPFDHVQIDLVTDLPPSPEGFKYVLVLVDVASKFCLLRPMKDKSASSVAIALLDIVRDFGLPRVLQTDQGREFDNLLVANLCQSFGIDHRMSSAYSPRTNGLVERTNRTWTTIIRKLAFFCQHLWPKFLPITQLFMNDRIARPIGTSPFEALFCRKMNLFQNYSDTTPSSSDPSPDQTVARIIRAQTELWPNLLMRSVKNHENMAQSFNEKASLASYEVGDIVFIRNPTTGKLDPLFDGPFRIVNKTAANTYDIIDLAGNPFHRRVTTSQIKLALSRDWPSDNDVFEFEEILDHRGSPDNWEFLVKWKNFPLEEASWVSQKDFTDPRVLKKYWESRGG